MPSDVNPIPLLSKSQNIFVYDPKLKITLALQYEQYQYSKTSLTWNVSVQKSNVQLFNFELSNFLKKHTYLLRDWFEVLLWCRALTFFT
jgi:hypothetical protein